ncbi:MAG: pyridoxal phosphate-dependent aminotransferase [bacterium]
MLLSKRAQNIHPSPTLAIDAKAKSLKKQGIDVIGFGAGEPDFDTPDNIKQAAVEAINHGFTKYCPSGGTPELKKAIIEKFKKDQQIEYQLNEVVVSCGAKHSLYNIFQAIVDRGDEVVIISPYWVSYPEMVMLAGGKPRIIKTKDTNGFRVMPEQLEKAINEKTKAVIINSPSNPTGVAYSREELKGIAEVLKNHNLTIVSDEIYEKLTFGDFEFSSIAQISEELKQKTIIVNGVSKTYSMTGWRIGYCAGNPEVIKAITDIQSQSTSNPTSIALKAAEEALNGPQESVEMMRQEFEKRRDYIYQRLNNIKGIKCSLPQGSFYVFPKISKLFGKQYDDKTITSSSDLAEYLLEKAKVAVVPGDGFGADDYIRISFATSTENITKGLDRIEEAVSKLSQRKTSDSLAG